MTDDYYYEPDAPPPEEEPPVDAGEAETAFDGTEEEDELEEEVSTAKRVSTF